MVYNSKVKQGARQTHKKVSPHIYTHSIKRRDKLRKREREREREREIWLKTIILVLIHGVGEREDRMN